MIPHRLDLFGFKHPKQFFLPPSTPPSEPPFQIMGVFSCRGGHRVLAASPEEAVLSRRGRALRTHSTSGRKRFTRRPPSSSSQGVGGRKTARCLSFASPTTLRCADGHFRHCVTELSTGTLAPRSHCVRQAQRRYAAVVRPRAISFGVFVGPVGHGPDTPG